MKNRYPINLPAVLREIELRALTEALAVAQGNRTKAAEMLGIKRTCLIMKIRKFGLVVKGPDAVQE